MTACLLAGTQFFLVLGSIWKTCARVVKMGCSLTIQFFSSPHKEASQVKVTTDSSISYQKKKKKVKGKQELNGISSTSKSAVNI